MTICRKIQQKTLLLTFPPSLLPGFILSFYALPCFSFPSITLLPFLSLFHHLFPFSRSFSSSITPFHHPSSFSSSMLHSLLSLHTPFPLCHSRFPFILILFPFPFYSLFLYGPLSPSLLPISSFPSHPSAPLLPFPSFSSCRSPVGPLPCHPPEHSFFPLPSKTSSRPSLPLLLRHCVHPSFLSSLFPSLIVSFPFYAPPSLLYNLHPLSPSLPPAVHPSIALSLTFSRFIVL